LVKNEIRQENFSNARNLLFGSIADLSIIESLDDSEDIESELYILLDDIDDTEKVSPAFTYQVSEEFGTALRIAAYDGALFVSSYDKSNKQGHLFTIREGVIEEKFAKNDVLPDMLFANEGLPILFDASTKKIGYIDNDEIAITEPELPSSPISAATYQNNLYTIHSDGIYKIGDAAKGYAKVTKWLEENESVPSDALHLAIDGNIYLFTRGGEILTYYKGKKIETIKAPFTSDGKTAFISPGDSILQYLIRYDMHRIYVIDKKTGMLTKTYHIDTLQKIIDVTVENDGTIYFLTEDGKIWRIR